MALTVIDRAIQSFGAEGVSQDTELAQRWAGLRTLRIADVRIFFLVRPLSQADLLVQGPDAVHIQQVGQRELKRAPELVRKAQEIKAKQDVLLKKHGFSSRL